jgi:hypothetical protein
MSGKQESKKGQAQTMQSKKTKEPKEKRTYETYSDMSFSELFKSRPVIENKDHGRALISDIVKRQEDNFKAAVEMAKKLGAQKKTNKSTIAKTKVDEDGNEKKVEFSSKELRALINKVLADNKLIITSIPKLRRQTKFHLLTMSSSLVEFFSKPNAYPKELTTHIAAMCKEKLITRTLLLKLLYFYIAHHKLSVQGSVSFFTLNADFKKCFGKQVEALRESKAEYRNPGSPDDFSTMGFFSLVSELTGKTDKVDSEVESRMMTHSTSIIQYIDRAKTDSVAEKRQRMKESSEKTPSEKKPSKKESAPPVEEPAKTSPKVNRKKPVATSPEPAKASKKS